MNYMTEKLPSCSLLHFAFICLKNVDNNSYGSFVMIFCCLLSFWENHKTLLPNSGFVLDEKFQRNASKFTTFYLYENQQLYIKYGKF